MSYKVTFIIPDEELHSFLRDVPEGRNAESITRVRGGSTNIHSHSYVNGKRNKGISGEDLLIQILDSDPFKAWSSEEIAERFVENGFAPQSLSSYLSRARQNGKIESLGNQYHSIKKGV